MSRILHQWRTDIYGNQYGLYKTDNGSLYKNNSAWGTFWYKDLNGKIEQAQTALNGINSFKTGAVSATTIKNFDVFYDTIMLETSSNLYFEKLNFDYDANKISSIVDDSFTINLSTDSGGWFADTWFFEVEKILTICSMVSSAANQYVYPILDELNIDNNNHTRVFPETSVDLIPIQRALSGYQFSHIERPVFTFNSDSKVFNVSFLGFTSTYIDSFVTVSINLGIGDKITVFNVFSIEPSNMLQ